MKFFNLIENKTSNIRKKLLWNLYNKNTIKQGFFIEMYTGGLPHKPYFIVLTLQGEIIIEPTKKMVAFYVIGDLVLMD